MRISLLAILSIACLLGVSQPVFAAGDAKKPRQVHWSFDGVFGTFDQAAIQRGLQVYREVCAACHGLKRVPFRKLSEIGFSEAEIKALAAEYTFMDGPDDEGEMFERAGRPFDYFPAPYANEQLARALNNGAYPHDLSLMIKARHDGANYMYSLLTGYGADVPEGEELLDGQYYNPYMAGGKIAMPQPFRDGQVDYQDGTEASVEQMAKDITHFLHWTAEPEMEVRKQMGVRVMIFLFIMTVLFYIAMKRIWADVKTK
jgi:ubiquinol-cytochrome c reductase cytochrome c1 subunit